MYMQIIRNTLPLFLRMWKLHHTKGSTYNRNFAYLSSYLSIIRHRNPHSTTSENKFLFNAVSKYVI